MEELPQGGTSQSRPSAIRLLPLNQGDVLFGHTLIIVTSIGTIFNQPMVINT